MPNDRLQLALELMSSGDWLVFERFASEFMAVEFPSLRTTASGSGDRGRDAEIFRPGEATRTAFQYSVTLSWRAKIKSTATTIATNFPDANHLIYCTNQQIGPAGDEVIAELSRKGLALEIRDRSWFVDRELTHPQREQASSELSERYVQPLLEARGIAERVARPLTSDESRVALLHLTLEGYDQQSQKNLTRSCFESLVRSALHGTNAENALSEGEVLDKVRSVLPVGNSEQIRAQVSGALARLSTRGGPLKQVGRTDQFHLSFEEQELLQDRMATFLLESAQLDKELGTVVAHLFEDATDEDVRDASDEVRTALEQTLLAKGEAFATAVASGNASHLGVHQILEVAQMSGAEKLAPETIATVVLDLLESPGPATHSHLRRLADGYTLFAFLRQTPDVQKVVLQAFQEGDVWLDTSMVLPLLAETLLEDAESRHFTTLMQAARDAGLRLFVTPGIVEEVERHIHRSLSFSRMESSAWHGSVPFLYAAHALAGRAREATAAWLEEFRGSEVPEQDIQDLLSDDFRIETRSLQEYSDRADPELRAAVQEIWHEVHERRRGSSGGSDSTPSVTLRLVAHDVENCVGVIELRRETSMGPMGYKTWWLTLDRTAFHLESKL